MIVILQSLFYCVFTLLMILFCWQGGFMKRLSIIVPVYNSEDYLEECLTSLVLQDVLDFEVIIVDSNSSDNSLDIIKKYCELLPDVFKYIHLDENKGVSVARNIGFKYASGEYIGFVDSDDFIHRNMYGDMLALIDICKDLRVVSTGVQRVLEKDNSKINVSGNMQTVDFGSISSNSINSAGNVVNTGNATNTSGNVANSATSINLADITALDIEIKHINLIIKNGDTFRYETNNDNITYRQERNELKIEEKGRGLFNDIEDTLVIYIPENFNLSKINIEAGAGKVEIENLKANNLDLELGAGEATVSNLNITGNCKLEGGAGRLSIFNGNINNLDLDMGMGEVNINSRITGNSDIDAGIGTLNLNLQGSKADYRIRLDKGVGNIRINGENISNGSTYGEGANIIKIDDGIGNINITVNE